MHAKDLIKTIFNKIDIIAFVADLESGVVLDASTKLIEFDNDIIGKKCWKFLFLNDTSFCKNCYIRNKNSINLKFNCDNYFSQEKKWSVLTNNEVDWSETKKARLLILKKTLHNKIPIHEKSYSEQRFKALSDASFEAIFIIKEGFIIETNKTVFNIFGYKTGELNDKFASKIIAPEKREEAKNRMLTGYEEHYKSIGIKKDGTRIKIEIRGAMLIYMGEKVRVTAIRDITKRTEAEKALTLSEEKYRTLFETTPAPIAIHKNGIIQKVNKAAIEFLGAKNLDEVIGISVLSLVHRENKDVALERLVDVLKKDIGKLTEMKFVTFNIELKDVETIVVPIIYEEENAYQIIFRDITERKKALNELQNSEKQLFHLNATKDKFFSIIAHDLRNPFNQLLGLTDLILENYNEYSFSELKEYIALLNKSAKNGYNLLENLLEWSRSQSGKKDINPFYFNFVQVCNKVIELLQANAKSKKINIVSKIPTDLKVFADVNVVNTTLINLLSNAIKFTKINGNIVIDAIKKIDRVIISVQDNGVGISNENINKLFRIDVHHSTKGTNNESGTGLGLILCHEFINLSKGEIWVESEKGVGSTFFFSLPISDK